MNTKMFRRKVSIFGIAVASVFGAPLPMIKKSHEDEADDPSLRVVEEDGIVSSEDIVQGEWYGYSAMDDYLYRLESLENLVSHDNKKDGKFWNTVSFLTKEGRIQNITGMRSDGIKFSVDKEFDIRDRSMFNQICQEFNKKLTVESA